jgi:TPR repeat protein
MSVDAISHIHESSCVTVDEPTKLERAKSIEQEDPALAAQWYREEITKGSTEAMVRLGMIYINGPEGKKSSVRKDEVKAVELFQQAKDKNDTDGIVNIGKAYLFGQGNLPQDKKEAVRLFKQAAERGNTEGMAFLALAYLQKIYFSTYFIRTAANMEGAIELIDKVTTDKVKIEFDEDFLELVEDKADEGWRLLTEAAKSGNSNAMYFKAYLICKNIYGLSLFDGRGYRPEWSCTIEDDIEFHDQDHIAEYGNGDLAFSLLQQSVALGNAKAMALITQFPLSKRDLIGGRSRCIELLEQSASLNHGLAIELLVYQMTAKRLGQTPTNLNKTTSEVVEMARKGAEDRGSCGCILALQKLFNDDVFFKRDIRESRKWALLSKARENREEW